MIIFLRPTEYAAKPSAALKGVPVYEFNKWYKDTHKRIRPIQVDGIPSAESKVSSGDVPVKEADSVRMAVTVCMSNRIIIKWKNYRDPSKDIHYNGARGL